MRFIKKIPKQGEHRTIKFFAWFPFTFELETRWFENVKLRQEYVGYSDGFQGYWETLGFEDFEGQ